MFGVKERYAKAVCKVAGMILIIIMLLFALPVQSVSAAMEDADTITLDISNIPDNAAYIDVLIDFENGKNYTKLNEDNLNRYDFDADELAQYNEGGFVSYSCHFKGIKTDMKIKEGKTVFVDEKTERQFYFDHNSLKIAVLDKSGHIMQVSDTVEINKNESHFGGTTNIYLAGDIKYDVGENKVEPDMFDNSTSTFGIIIAYENLPLAIGVLVAFVGLIITLVILIKRRHIRENNGGEVKSSQKTVKVILIAIIILGVIACLASLYILFFAHPR